MNNDQTENMWWAMETIIILVAILAAIGIGVAAGVLTRVIVRNERNLKLIPAMLLGIAGAVVGGIPSLFFIASKLDDDAPLNEYVIALLVSLGIALIVSFIVLSVAVFLNIICDPLGCFPDDPPPVTPPGRLTDNQRTYQRALDEVNKFSKSPGCVANAAARDTADSSLHSAAYEYKKGKPEDALKHLKGAADALGMTGATYNSFWPHTDPNPESRDERKYKEALAAVERFRDSVSCNVGGLPRENAKVELAHAAASFQMGAVRDALSNLKDAADHLGMNEDGEEWKKMYQKYWPTVTENPLSRDEQKFQAAEKAVTNFMGSPNCSAGEAGRQKADLQIKFAKTSYSSGAPRVALDELKEAADALGMKENQKDVYELYWPPEEDPGSAPPSAINPQSEDERKYQRAFEEVEALRVPLCDGKGFDDVNAAACKAAQYAIDDSKREFGGGRPDEAMQELKKAADALGMKEKMGELYNVFWPAAAAGGPALVNPVSHSEQRYLDAHKAVENALQPPGGHPPDAEEAAKLYLQYAERDYTGGRPEDAMEQLRKAADGLGMTGGSVYKVFWPDEPTPGSVDQKKNPDNPISEEERNYTRAKEQVEPLKQGEPDEAVKTAAGFHYDDAEREFSAGKPLEALAELKKAADALKMKDKNKVMYQMFWPDSPAPELGGQKKNPDNPISEEELNYTRAEDQVKELHKELSDDKGIEANPAACTAAEYHRQDARRKFEGGDPAEALQELKKAADALGMKERNNVMYDVFWPTTSPGLPLTPTPTPVNPVNPADPNNPISVAEQKYVDARDAVINFAGGPNCHADGSARSAAELSVEYANRQFKAGEPDDALKELKKAADALDMRRTNEEMYDLFWSRW